MTREEKEFLENSEGAQELIKYCVSKVDGVKIGCDGDRIIFPDNQSIPLNSLSHFPIHAKHLLSRTCDALGIYVEKTAFGWMHCGANRGGFYTTADEARIAAIKRYMEVEG